MEQNQEKTLMFVISNSIAKNEVELDLVIITIQVFVSVTNNV